MNRWTPRGRRAKPAPLVSSLGFPNRYLGTTWAPRRIARKAFSALREASTAMSVAELPIPSTSTRLPSSTSGVL